MSRNLDGRVVRPSLSAAKQHIPADEHAALCGLNAPDAFGWRITGDRQQFEEIAPERLCKRCLKAEQS